MVSEKEEDEEASTTTSGNSATIKTVYRLHIVDLHSMVPSLAHLSNDVNQLKRFSAVVGKVVGSHPCLRFSFLCRLFFLRHQLARESKHMPHHFPPVCTFHTNTTFCCSPFLSYY